MDADAGADDPEFKEWAAEFDRLDASVAAARTAGDPRAAADAMVDIAVHLLGSDLLEEAIDAMIAARDAYLEVPSPGDQGPVEATECAFWAANLAMRTGDYETALDGFGAAAHEYAARGMTGHAAENDNNLGTAATQLGLFAAAEQSLERSISGYRTAGMPARIPGVRVNLANVYRLSGRQDLAESVYLETLPTFPAGSDAAARCTASLAALYAEQRRVAESRVECAHAIEMFRALRSESDALDCELILAHLDLLSGAPQAAADRAQRVRMAFAGLDRADKIAACDVNLANFHLLSGQFTEADAAFERARIGLIETGIGHNLPNLEWSRFERFQRESAQGGANSNQLARAALDAGVASVIGTDHQRFQFPDAHRRIRWREVLASRLAAVFDAAFALGDDDLLADLIEMGLNAGVYYAPGAAGEHGVESVQVPGAPNGFDAAPAGPPMVSPDDPDDGALTLGAASLLSTAELPLAPPPALWIPAVGTSGGRQVLARYRRLAADRDPALASVLSTRPRVAIW